MTSLLAAGYHRAHPRRSALWRKRVFDLVVVLATLPLTVPLGLVLAALVLICDGGPVLYRARRAGRHGQPFDAFKFRTMRPDRRDRGVSGGDKSARVTRLGAVLRRWRLDELPQLFNILRGDMGCVGPRPPDPRYVAMYPETYGRVLQVRPGLTGLATLHMHRREARWLARCATPAQTEEVYCRRCIPRKARLDAIYQRRLAGPGVVLVDLWIVAASILSLAGRRLPRV